jgi:type I restriction enzyme, S subunit
MQAKPYPRYKDSGVEWLGQLPDDWETKPLKFAVRMNTDVLDEDTEPNLEFRYADISSITADGRIGDTESTTFDKAPSRARRKVKEGDTVVSTVRTYLKAIAVVDAAAENLIVSTGFAVLRPSDFEPRFLWRLVQSEPFVQSVVANSEGVGYPAIPPSKLGVLRTWCPPLPEQRAIAEFLDRETAKIDELIAKKERLIDLLEEKRAALITHAVTRGLNPDAPLRDSGVEWLGQIPKHWEVRRLRFISRIQTGSKNTEDATDNGEYPFFVRAQTVERIGSCTFDCEAVLTAGDGVGVGKVFHHYTGKFDVHQRVYAITDFRNVRGRFLYLYMKELFYRVALGGEAKSTVDSLRRHNFTDFAVALPPTSEQNAIIKYCDAATRQSEAVASAVRTAIDCLREYRSALITAAVTGKIDVRDEVKAAA